MNTVGNIFSGQVVGETAKNLSERFGKVVQERRSITYTMQDVNRTFNTQLDALIPASKISTLTQGMFVGAVSDNFGERIEQKIFHAEIVVDADKVEEETAAYEPIPLITDFRNDTPDKSKMKAAIQFNYNQVKQDVKDIVAKELDRIRRDPALRHLLRIK